MTDKTLHKGKFVELKLRETDEYKYEYLHESRCGGTIVAVLPVKFDENGMNMMVRYEFTPCWGDGLHVSSITGGFEKDKHDTIIDTVIEELREEAGIKLNNELKIKSLGTCRGTKSSDTLYHLYLVDLSDDSAWEEVEIETDGSALEGKAHNEWITNSEDTLFDDGVDPLLYVMYTRWSKGKAKPVNRKDI